MPMLESKQFMIYILLTFLVLVNSGCCWFKGKHRSVEPVVVISPSPAQMLPLRNAKILDQEKFNEGGRILVLPFTPGVNVAANDQLERVSLMIVKGAADSLGTDSRFTVLDSQNAGTADLILEGRIVTMQKTGKIKKLTTFKDKKYIEVEGKLIDAKSGHIVFHFSDSKESKNKKQTFNDLALAIGQDIGKLFNAPER